MTPSLVLPPRVTPSVLAQTPWRSGFYRFPSRYRVEYFNPSLCIWRNERWLVTRRRRCSFQPARNDLTMWRLTPDATALLDGNERPVKIHSVRLDEHWEDPRALVLGDTLYLSFANFYTRCNYVHQGLAQINHAFQSVNLYHPLYGDNAPTISTQTGHEKNWLWFAPRDGGPLCMVYSAFPHTVVQFTPQRTREWTAKGIRWSKGLIRGGTPPVYVPEDDLYWSFFHSSVELGDTPPRRCYYMGAYAFDPAPPYRCRRRSSTALLIGSPEDPRPPSAPLCVFPCGALFDGATWHVTLGVNDIACAWMKIPHKELKQRCIPVR